LGYRAKWNGVGDLKSAGAECGIDEADGATLLGLGCAGDDDAGEKQNAERSCRNRHVSLLCMLLPNDPA
jgi:hypothetical protein